MLIGLLLKGMLVGMIIAIPVGPVGVLCIRRTILHGRLAGFLSDRVIVFASRPGRVKEIVPIDLPRPRSFAVKRTREFVAYVDKIWKLLEQEVFNASLVESPN